MSGTNPPKTRAPRNKTLSLSSSERSDLSQLTRPLHQPANVTEIENRTIHQDLFQAIPFLPPQCVDLLFVDPPYNLNKNFGSSEFRQRSTTLYLEWLESWLKPLLRVLKPTASLYLCGDWRSAAAIQLFAEKNLHIQTRITWEREKGRGAQRNWKSCSEDIWFCTVSDDYFFDVEAVKLKKRVLAPYTDKGQPKDWEKSPDGDFRLTSPSNLWTDISIPFWSMPENTDHPTQKPEKLLAKIILASSRPGDLILDPFLGSGTTSVVAKKLGRRYVGIEIDPEFCCLAEKRLSQANHDASIQGYAQGVFWERNSQPVRKSIPREPASTSEDPWLIK